MSYEYFITDRKLKMIFHHNELNVGNEVPAHWHKNPEFLLMTKGTAAVQSDAVTVSATVGEIAVIEGNRLHTIRPENGDCTYFCMIPDDDLWNDCEKFPYLSDSQEAVRLFRAVSEEIAEKLPHCEAAAQGYARALIALLSREATIEQENAEKSGAGQKLISVRAAVDYIYKHCEEPITVSDICNAVNLSKYYLCHIFKEVTGSTVLSHLNRVRLEKAMALIKSGKAGVSESAFLCGFRNLSYFSRAYKAFSGHSPNMDLPKNKK